jgi:hypothetical protein
MKTIRINKTSIVERVSDKKAVELVNGNKAVYVKKTVWKKEVRDTAPVAEAEKQT